MKTPKKIVSLFCMCALLLLASFDSKPAKGIRFINGDFNQALELSIKTGKPIFADIYAKWCGPCKQLERTTFKDPEVGEYYNANFICIRIDGETHEGEVMRKLYGVNSYPTLLIINSNGKLMARAESFMKPYILINFGKRVVP